MADDEPNQLRSKRWIAFVVALPVLYVLSIGPFIWIGYRLPSPIADKLDPIVRLTYYPVIFVAGSSERLWDLLCWYTNLI